VTEDGHESIISFSLQLFETESVHFEYSTASSFDILTWKQVMSKESSESVLPAVKNHYNEKELLRDKQVLNGKQIFFYGIHDGKMHYILMQCALYNRKYSPFLLCTCTQGTGVQNNKSHVCHILTHYEQVCLYYRSERRFHTKCERDGDAYGPQEHLD